MAIAPMQKFIIASHQSESQQLLERLQDQGICQILNAEQAMVCKDIPDMCCAGVAPKELQSRVGRLEKALDFLKSYTPPKKGIDAMLAPRAVIDEQQYQKTVSDETLMDVLEQSEQVQSQIDKLNGKIENLQGTLEHLEPWRNLSVPVEELYALESSVCLTGLLPAQHMDAVSETCRAHGAVIEQVGTSGTRLALLIVTFKDKAAEVQKLLRSADFEQVGFEGFNGTVTALIDENQHDLKDTRNQLQQQHEKAGQLAQSYLELEILYDHYANLLGREDTHHRSPATDSTVVLEGWVKKNDYKKLQATLRDFAASDLQPIEPAEGEEIPVEIENTRTIRPFELVTRLYGMPEPWNIDPTIFLAPFFAIFFGMCLADAGYGLVLVILSLLLVKKMQGDTKLLVMLGMCGAATVIIGALTGGWFGDGIQQLNIPWMIAMRKKFMWFDPLENPMIFFYLSLGLGYFQIQFGLFVAFCHNLRQQNFIAAICDQLTWLTMLNSLLLFGFSKAGLISPEMGKFFGMLALVPAVMIFLFSHREGGIGARLGMGFYNLFSTIFFVGDVLSYLRLMALGMVGAGMAMAFNVISKQFLGIGWGIGIALTIFFLIFLHTVNLALAVLSAFVHTLRLQYVEFFPKFLVGGGREFEPLNKTYKHIYIKK